MKDSLLTYFGARFDLAHFGERDYVATINGVKSTITAPYDFKRDVHQTKPNVGALYKITPDVRVYANYSESYFVNQTDNPSVVLSPTYAPETAQGYDFGFKGSFFHDRLNYTIGGYYIQRNNVSVTDNVETSPGSGSFVDVVEPAGNQLDRGIEADITWNVNSVVATGLSYGHVNAIWTDMGSKYPEVVGRPVQNISPTNGGAWVKFTAPDGAWQGFSTNVGVTYVSATPTEAPNAGDVVARVGGVQTVTSSTNQWALSIPSFTLWNVGFNYKWKTGSHFSHSLRLNVNNVFNHHYLKVSKLVGDSRGLYLSYTLDFGRLFSH